MSEVMPPTTPPTPSRVNGIEIDLRHHHGEPDAPPILLIMASAPR